MFCVAVCPSFGNAFVIKFHDTCSVFCVAVCPSFGNAFVIPFHDTCSLFCVAVCPSFGNALATASGSACVPHSDCLGIDCDITFKHHLISGKIDFSLRVNPLQRKVTITADGGEQDITGDGG